MRLASQLTGLDIDILTEAEESQRRQAEFADRTKLFVDSLDLDEFFAQLLVAEGFTSLEEVAYVDLDELLAIEGVDEGTAGELQARARDVIEEQNRKAIEAATALGVEQSLFDFEGLTPQMIEALAKDDVKTLEDFATCADWELAGGWTTVDGARHKDEGILEKFDMSLEEAQALIARGEDMRGAMVRGIIPSEEATVTPLAASMQDTFARLQSGQWGVVIGHEMARVMGVTVGDPLTVVAPSGQVTPAGVVPRLKQMTVAGTFDSGHYEYDSALVLLHHEDAQRIFRLEGPTGVRLKLKDLHQAREVAQQLAGSRIKGRSVKVRLLD